MVYVATTAVLSSKASTSTDAKRHFSRRFQLFEFGDQPWFRGILREAYLDCLNFVLSVGGQYASMHKPFGEWAAGDRNKAVLDLCSGGGGPICTIIDNAEQDGVELPTIILSDLFPDIAHFESLRIQCGSDVINFVSEPLSADNASSAEIRLRSICSAFHHFPPETAAAIIRDAARNGDGIFIMEPFQRSWRHLLMMFLMAVPATIAGMLSPFFSPRFRFGKMLVCTIVPLIPLALHFDGIVSVLRTYTASEIAAMFPDDERHNFVYVNGEHPYGLQCAATFFYARRKE